MHSSDPETVTLSREELYGQVWTTPMCHLAKKYGVYHADLARICERHSVPRPPMGYWSKKEFGKAPPQTPLPACEKPELQTISIHKTVREQTGTEPPTEPTFDDDLMQLLQQSKELPKVEVRSTLRGSHPLVRRTSDVLSRSKLDENRLTTIPSALVGSALNVRVGRRSVRRALLFLDALVRAIEGLGGKVVMEKDRDHDAPKTVVVLAGEKAAVIRVRERCNRSKNERGTGPFPWRDYKHRPSGLLTLDGGSSYKPYCEDTDRRGKIEDQINKALVRFVEMAGKERIWRREREEERRRREAWEKERAVKLPLIEREEKKLARLQKKVEAWHESQRMRQYIQAVRDAAVREHGPVEEGSEMCEWLIWAEQQADRTDPLIESPPSILDEKAKYERRDYGW